MQSPDGISIRHQCTAKPSLPYGSSKYSSIEVYKPYSSKRKQSHIFLSRGSREHNMGGDESQCMVPV